MGALPRFGGERVRLDPGSLFLGVGSTLSREAPNRVELSHCSANNTRLSAEAPAHRGQRDDSFRPTEVFMPPKEADFHWLKEADSRR